ncbi:hypothetical protein N7493_005683, partial [Penicillium malachiteum]
CQVVARGRPRKLIGIEWLVIVSELSQKLEEVLAPRLWKRELGLWEIISANPAFPPQKLYEILTVYIPADLDDTTVSSLEKSRVSPHWPEEPDCESTEEPSAMSGLISQEFGWLEGKVEYHGRAARQLVYFFKFKDEEVERRYKETMMGASGKVMELFLGEPRRIGM